VGDRELVPGASATSRSRHGTPTVTGGHGRRAGWAPHEGVSGLTQGESLTPETLDTIIVDFLLRVLPDRLAATGLMGPRHLRPLTFYIKY